MLTFIGNKGVPITCGLRAAIFLFAFGSACAAAFFTSAYVTELNYGRGNPDDVARGDRWFYGSCFSAAVSLASFVVGVIVAALSL